MIGYFIIIIFIISFLLAFYSMKDFQLPQEIKKILRERKIRGRIIFFKDKIENLKLQFKIKNYYF